MADKPNFTNHTGDDYEQWVSACEYCNGKKVLLEGNDGYGFFINNSTMIIIEQSENDSYILDNIFIDYCPKCGRDLSE